MARSNTLPIEETSTHSGSKKFTKPNRSATVQYPPQTHKHTPHLPHIPLPHNPFHSKSPPQPSTAGSSQSAVGSSPSVRISSSAARPPTSNSKLQSTNTYNNNNNNDDNNKNSTSTSNSNGNTKENGNGGRPSALNRQNSVQTRYMNMLLDLDTIPRLHNILASFFNWILLAGFVIFPATFTQLGVLTDDANFLNDPATQQFLRGVKHVSLLYVAGFSSGIGAAGMCWLWWKWGANYVWLLNKIFLPGTLNSLAGVISTLVNVYSQQAGIWSTIALVTAGVTGGSCLICLILFLIYNFSVLSRVKERHRREMRIEDGGHEGEGFVEKLERKAAEPPMEPGSVI